MDLVAIHWQQLSLALGVLTAVLAGTYGLLSLALPQRAAWTARVGDHSQYRQTFPVERRKARRPHDAAWPHPALS